MSSVVVVGGGLAGLVCALRLRRAGHEVEVLEAGAQPGGRARSQWLEGFRLDPGAAQLAGGDANLRALCGALGLGARLRPVQGREAVLRGARLEAAASGFLGGPSSPGLSARARAGLLRLGLELVRHARRLDPHHPEAAAALDGEGLAPGLRRLAGDEAFESLLAPRFAMSWGIDPEALSLASGLLSLRRSLGRPGEQSLEGGLGLLAQALAERVSVRIGCEVTSVETETDGARVRYRRQGQLRAVLADAVVVAIPAPGVARICPKLAPAERGFFEQMRQARGMLAHLLLDEPARLRGFAAVAFRPLDAPSLYGVSLRPGAAPDGRGLLTAVFSEAGTHRLWEASGAEVERSLLDSLARTPLGRPSSARCAVRRWDAAAPVFAPGSLRRLRGFLGRVERSPRLAFAGDYLVGPHAEAAVTSGMRAASEIATSL